MASLYCEVPFYNLDSGTGGYAPTSLLPPGVLHVQPNEKLEVSQFNSKYSHCSLKARGKNGKSPSHRGDGRTEMICLQRGIPSTQLLSDCVLSHGHASVSKLSPLFSCSSRCEGNQAWKQATTTWHHVDYGETGWEPGPGGGTGGRNPLSGRVTELPRGSNTPAQHGQAGEGSGRATKGTGSPRQRAGR